MFFLTIGKPGPRSLVDITHVEQYLRRNIVRSRQYVFWDATTTRRRPSHPRFIGHPLPFTRSAENGWRGVDRLRTSRVREGCRKGGGRTERINTIERFGHRCFVSRLQNSIHRLTAVLSDSNRRVFTTVFFLNQIFFCQSSEWVPTCFFLYCFIIQPDIFFVLFRRFFFSIDIVSFSVAWHRFFFFWSFWHRLLVLIVSPSIVRLTSRVHVSENFCFVFVIRVIFEIYIG